MSYLLYDVHLNLLPQSSGQIIGLDLAHLKIRSREKHMSTTGLR